MDDGQVGGGGKNGKRGWNMACKIKTIMFERQMEKLMLIKIENIKFPEIKQ